MEGIPAEPSGAATPKTLQFRDAPNCAIKSSSPEGLAGLAFICNGYYATWLTVDKAFETADTSPLKILQLIIMWNTREWAKRLSLFLSRHPQGHSGSYLHPEPSHFFSPFSRLLFHASLPTALRCRRQFPLPRVLPQWSCYLLPILLLTTHSVQPAFHWESALCTQKKWITFTKG